MGFRFQRRFKIAPGITLNLSKSGVSTSLGTRGAHVTLGHGQTRTTVGAPGTGLSYTHVERDPDANAASVLLRLLGYAVVIAAVIWLLA